MMAVGIRPASAHFAHGSMKPCRPPEASDFPDGLSMLKRSLPWRLPRIAVLLLKECMLDLVMNA
jgi:hypothetical protein